MRIPSNLVREGVRMAPQSVKEKDGVFFFIINNHAVRISPNDPPRCSCPYYMFRHLPCKHIVAGLKYVALVKGPEEVEKILSQLGRR
jgi:hypothetical protein